MKANSSNLILSICLLCLILTSKTGICANCDDNTKAIKAGYKLVEDFYSCLMSDIKQSFCNNIFSNHHYLPKDDSELIWTYSSKNKQLFIWNSDTIKNKDFFKWSTKTISYYNPKNLNKISEGQLYIMLVHALPDRFYSGISKEVAFPIVKDESFGEYRIEFRNIKINGILIDLENNFIRDFNIIESLGFNSESIKNKTNKIQ